MKKCYFGEPRTGPGSPGLPWLPLSFVARFESWPTSGWSVFEWGSGWSTIWLAERCARVVSMESDLAWHERIARERERYCHPDFTDGYVGLPPSPHERW
jgi:hypothetical protein